MSKERPILFSGPMVRAILDGRKTQTRRVVNPQPSEKHIIPERDSYIMDPVIVGDGHNAFAEFRYTMGEVEHCKCPYGRPGDRLWVRETLKASRNSRGEDPIARYAVDTQMVECPEDQPALVLNMRFARWQWQRDILPSIHMPRWASRITLEVEAVRVERLQDISNADCFAEGLPVDTTKCNRTWYGDLWEEINGPGSWDTNPWVWVVTFRRVK